MPNRKRWYAELAGTFLLWVEGVPDNPFWRALARKRGEDFQFLLGRWVVERFLFRLAGSSQKDSFVLKGARLFLASQRTAPGYRCRSIWGSNPTVRPDTEQGTYDSHPKDIVGVPVPVLPLIPSNLARLDLHSQFEQSSVASRASGGCEHKAVDEHTQRAGPHGPPDGGPSAQVRGGVPISEDVKTCCLRSDTLLYSD